MRSQVGRKKFFEKVIYRKVNFERGPEMNDTLNKFLDEVIGLSYKFSREKMLRRRTIVEASQ